MASNQITIYVYESFKSATPNFLGRSSWRMSAAVKAIPSSMMLTG